MADLSAVENAVVTLLAGALFTSAYSPGAYQACVTGATVKLYRGWPESANLTADTKAGNTHVTVFGDQGMTRDVSRWQVTPVTVTAFTPTVTVSTSGAAVTLGGAVTAGNVIGIQCGAPLTAYGYICLSSDTLTTAAAALAAKITGATSSGATITLPTSLYVHAATMVPQTVYSVVQQQEQSIRVSVWAPNPIIRDAVASTIANSIAGLKNTAGALTRFFPVGSYETARIKHRTDYSNDMPSRDSIWRRDICYTVEYATTLIESDPSMLFGGGTISLNNSGTTQQMGAIAPH